MKAEKIRAVLELIKSIVKKYGGCSCEAIETLKQELAELEALATEYQSPEIQRKIAIADAAEAAFVYMSLTDAPNAPDETICLGRVDDLLTWYRERTEVQLMWSTICDVIKLNKNKAIQEIKRSNFICGLPRIHKLSNGCWMLYAWGFEMYMGRR